MISRASIFVLALVCAPAVGQHAATQAVFDGHNDLAIHYLRANPRWSVDAHDLAVRLPGQSDLPRWRAGGIEGALVTVGSDLPPGTPGHFSRVLASLDWFDAMIDRYPQDLARVGASADLRRARRSGRIALIPAIEGGEQLDASLDNLRLAHRRGVRSITIIYDHHNEIGDGAMVLEQSRSIARTASGGLTAFGRRLIGEMNRIGVLVDLSHAAESTALDALAASRAPIIFSHSGARALSDSPRNVSDAVLRAVRANGGIVMVTLVPYLTTTEHWRWWSSGEARYAALVTAHGEDRAAIARGMEEWDRSNPEPVVRIAHVADQIEHVARVAGHDHVGIGTDFDGMDRFVIPELADASRLPALFDELARRGWSHEQLHRLAIGNFERVLASARR